MPEPNLLLTRIEPTVFLKQQATALAQLVRIHVNNTGEATTGSVTWQTGSRAQEVDLGILPVGESVHEIYVDEVREPVEVTFALKCAESVIDQRVVPWQPPRRWTVHVVQTSHHDVGYTDLASNVLRVHDQWLNDAIDMAEATQNQPDDAQFRIVIEQAWSLIHFLRHAPPARASRILGLLR